MESIKSFVGLKNKTVIAEHSFEPTDLQSAIVKDKIKIKARCLICKVYKALNVVSNRAVSINNYKDHVVCHSKLNSKHEKKASASASCDQPSAKPKTSSQDKCSSSQSMESGDTTSRDTLTAQQFDQIEMEFEESSSQMDVIVTTEESAGANIVEKVRRKNKLDKPLNQCQVCSKTFKSKTKLIRHLGIHKRELKKLR